MAATLTGIVQGLRSVEGVVQEGKRFMISVGTQVLLMSTLSPFSGMKVRSGQQGLRG